MAKPFSYVVPVGNFGSVDEVWDLDGKVMVELDKRPLNEGVQDDTQPPPDPAAGPGGAQAQQQGRRELAWRADGQGLTFLEQEPPPPAAPAMTGAGTGATAATGGAARAAGGRGGRRRRGRPAAAPARPALPVAAALRQGQPQDALREQHADVGPPLLARSPGAVLQRAHGPEHGGDTPST